MARAGLSQPRAGRFGGRQEEAEHDAEQRRERAADERRLEIDGVGDRTQGDGRDPAEAHREPDREPGGHADVLREIHLGQHHREAERADHADADDRQRDRPGDPAASTNTRISGVSSDLRDEQRPPDSEAVGDRPEQQRPDRAREQHQREQPVALRLRVTLRDGPQRHERDQGEPRDAAEPDHAPRG